MRISKNTESSLMMKPRFFSWKRWMKEMLNCRRVKRQAQKTRRELLNLGQHLFKDLGLNSKGYPMKPNCHPIDSYSGMVANPCGKRARFENNRPSLLQPDCRSLSNR